MVSHNLNGIAPNFGEMRSERFAMSRLTLEQIAELAGVSRSTASRVVRNQGSVSTKARDRVLAVVEETGYHPNTAARMLAGSRTNIIGFVISEVMRFALQDPYFGRLIEGITQAANENNQTLTLFLMHSEEEIDQVTSRILQTRLVDGLIVSNTIAENPILPRLLEHQLPFVIIGRDENPAVNYIDSDNYSGAYSATTHLARQGRQRIGTITGSIRNYSAIDRLQGYKDALLERRMSIDPNLIVHGDFVETDGYIGMKKLLAHNVDAVFAASDKIAIGAMQAVYEAGLTVPNDIAIVGFDDLPLASTVTPALTTMRQVIRGAGRMAVETLLDNLSNRNMPPRRISLPTELVIRRSCGALTSNTR